MRRTWRRMWPRPWRTESMSRFWPGGHLRSAQITFDWATVTSCWPRPPLWSLAAALLHLSDLGGTPVEQVVVEMTAHLRLWGASIVGRSTLLWSTPPSNAHAMKGASE